MLNVSLRPNSCISSFIWGQNSEPPTQRAVKWVSIRGGNQRGDGVPILRMVGKWPLFSPGFSKNSRICAAPCSHPQERTGSFTQLTRQHTLGDPRKMSKSKSNKITSFPSSSNLSNCTVILCWGGATICQMHCLLFGYSRGQFGDVISPSKLVTKPPQAASHVLK